MLLRSDVLSALAVTAAIGLAVQSDLGQADASSAMMTDAHVAVSFAEQVAPILKLYCSECHSEENAELGLKLDTYEGLMAGSDYGTVVEAGDADGSLLIDMISSGDMPEDGDPVPPEDLELLKTWINEGALKN
jgi:hypothetical protein